MANYKSNKGKTFLSVIAIILALLLIASITLGIGDHFYGWFDKSDEETVQTDEADNDGMVISSVAARGIELSLKSMASEVFVPELGVDDDEYDTSKYTVTATITPSTATNKDVTMSVAWANAGSDWASGKTVTDYVTIEQESEGSLTGSITCIEAFGEQVILTVTSDADSDISATATIDYLKRVTSSSFSISQSNTSDIYYIGDSTFSLNCYVQLGTGTITGEYKFGPIYYGLNISDYSTAMTYSSVVGSSAFRCYIFDGTLTDVTLFREFTSTFSSMVLSICSTTFTDSDIEDLIEVDQDPAKDYYDTFSSLGYMSIGFITYYEYSYGDAYYVSEQLTCTANFYFPTVEAVALSYDSIVF